MSHEKAKGRFGKLVDFAAMLDGRPPEGFGPREREIVEDLEGRGLYSDPAAFIPALNLGAIDDRVYIREPVRFEEWIKDPFYAGPNLSDGFYPVVLKRLTAIFDPARKPPVREVYMTGSIGWGKTYSTATAMVYLLYLISCLRDPHRTLGIKKGTEIVFVNLSVTGNQAKNTLFGNVRSIVDDSPYFHEHFRRAANNDSTLIFPYGVVYRPGNSRETTAIGANVICGAIDEVNFLVSSSKAAHEKLAGEVDHARTLHAALSKRVKTRFMHSTGFRGMVFMLSSRTYEDSFLDALIEKGREDPEVEILEYSHWDVRDRHEYSGKTFRVSVGGAGVVSRILGPDEPVDPSTRVVVVPEEYRNDFRVDVEGSLRDLAGVSTTTLSPFMNGVAVKRAQVTNLGPLLGLPESKAPAPLVHPFVGRDGTEWTYSDCILSDFKPELIAKRTTRKEGSRVVEEWRPLRSPEEPRFIGLDCALTRDSFGFAMGYVAGTRAVSRRNLQTGETAVELLPLIVYEILASFAAPVGGEVQTSDIRAFIYRLRELGFYISMVTTDSYQSADMRQILSSGGFEVDELSVDSNLDCPETIRSAISEGWAYYYPHATAERELLKVRRVVTATKKLKIDHPPRDQRNRRTGLGSKDVFDAMAQVAWTILHNYTPVASLLAPSPGGYEEDERRKAKGEAQEADPETKAEDAEPRPPAAPKNPGLRFGDEDDDPDSWADRRWVRR